MQEIKKPVENVNKKIYMYLLYGGITMVIITAVIYFSWSNGRIINGLSIAGVKVGGLKITEAEQALSKSVNPLLEKKVSLNYQNKKFTIVPGTIGIKINIPASIRQAYRVGRTGSVFGRLLVRLKVFHRGMEIKPVFVYTRDTLAAFYRLLDAIIAVEPIRSVITVNRDGNVTFSPSRTGREVEYRRLTELFEKSLTDKTFDQITIPVKSIIPALTESDIKKWSMDQIISVFSTKFDPSNSDRVHNIETARSAIDNTIVYPGQSFSFNTWVGPRVSEAGYKEAPVIYLGKIVPGVGGGICQVSSTLYNAVLLADLKVIQRSNHSLPSNYVPLGRDATVVYGDLDFIFENNNQNPILLSAKVESPYITVAVLGEKLDWDQVTLRTVVLNTYPYGVKEMPDPQLAKGKRVKISNGQKGYKVQLWRDIFLKNGQTKNELINTSIYPSQPEEYKIGHR